MAPSDFLKILYYLVVYSYACKFVIGLYIYIKSRKVRWVSSLIYRRFSDDRESYIFPQHIDIIFDCQCAY